MTKIDIISGFLGAGKTTLIKKLLKDSFVGEQVVLIENEFGEIGIDGGFLKEAGIEIREMNSGCICCSLVGDFGVALKEVIETYHPDRIVIEPSGVGKLSDVTKAVLSVEKGEEEIQLNSLTTVVDVKKCKMYLRNFGEFFTDQVANANTIILSRTDIADEKKIQEAVQLLKDKMKENATLVTTPVEKLSGAKLLEAMEKTQSLAQELMQEETCPVCGGHHHHDHDGECDHDHEHHHHHDGECDHDHEHHHHHDGECDHDHEHHHHHEGECDHDHDHEHHHHHDEECGCGHDHHHHDHEGECDHDHEHHHHHDGECGCGHDHHHHHADEVFTSWGCETTKVYTKDQIQSILQTLSQTQDYGVILRSKGMVEGADGQWIYFDMVPEEWEVRQGEPDYTGRICVIGSNLKEDKLKELFA